MQKVGYTGYTADSRSASAKGRCPLTVTSAAAGWKSPTIASFSPNRTERVSSFISPPGVFHHENGSTGFPGTFSVQLSVPPLGSLWLNSPRFYPSTWPREGWWTHSFRSVYSPPYSWLFCFAFTNTFLFYGTTFCIYLLTIKE